jgi:hypothetical protein
VDVFVRRWIAELAMLNMRRAFRLNAGNVGAIFGAFTASEQGTLHANLQDASLKASVEILERFFIPSLPNVRT